MGGSIKKIPSRLVYLTDLMELMVEKKRNSKAVLKAVKGKILTPGHSEPSDLMKCHRWLLKHDINIFDVLMLCFLRASQAASERVESHEWPVGHGM